MSPFYIILTALLFYPVLASIVVIITAKNPSGKKRVLFISLFISFLAIFGLATGISTINEQLDWWLVSLVYFSICLLLIYTQYQPNRLFRTMGVIFMILVLGLGYLSATVGALGVGFIVSDFESDYEKQLDEKTSYKEFIIGNALSDHRYKKFEVYRSFSWLPVFEKKIHHLNYNASYSLKPLHVIYQPNTRQVVLTADMNFTDNVYANRKDTIYLKE